jgi:hypothetical protein
MELHYKVTAWCKLKFKGNIKKEDIVKKLEEGYLPLEIGYDKIVPNFLMISSFLIFPLNFNLHQAVTL